MPRYKQDMILPYSPEQMFELVSDIKRYPEFVKWIRALRVSDPRDEGAVHHCTGEAVVAFKGLTQSFSTSVAANSEARRVEVKLLRGPLRRLTNSWQFDPHADGGTHLYFEVVYEFSSFFLGALARANHELAIDKLMGAFLAEAKRRYGRSLPLDTTSK